MSQYQIYIDNGDGQQAFYLPGVEELPWRISIISHPPDQPARCPLPSLLLIRFGTRCIPCPRISGWSRAENGFSGGGI